MATNNTGTEEQKPAEEVEGQAPEQTEQGNKPDTEQAEGSEGQGENEEQGEQEESEEGKSKLSHDDALEALSKTRKSEAAYRTRLREAEQKLEAAKTPEEVETAIADIKNANATDARNLLVENVALRNGLPDDLAEALKGDTREELEAHAKKLAKYAPAVEEEDPDLSGGLDPSGNPQDFDAKAEAQKMRKQRRRGR